MQAKLIACILCAGDDAKIKDANIQLASNAAIY
jgi:hypothetical protein